MCPLSSTPGEEEEGKVSEVWAPEWPVLGLSPGGFTTWEPVTLTQRSWGPQQVADTSVKPLKPSGEYPGLHYTT